MSTNAKILNKTLVKEIQLIKKIIYSMIKLVSFQGCRDCSIHANLRTQREVYSGKGHEFLVPGTQEAEVGRSLGSMSLI
jgi:hypothetical protein